MMASTSPSWTESEMSFNTSVLPKLLRACSTETSVFFSEVSHSAFSFS